MALAGFAFCAGLRRPLARWLLVAMFAWAFAFASAHSARAQSQASGVYASEAVRALFLINFLSFTEWPEGSLQEGVPYVIGVAGSRALEEELLGLAEKKLVRERRIRVVRVKSTRDLGGCHLVYINPSPILEDEAAPGAQELLPALRGQAVLTVSASPTFLAAGGIVNLYTAEQGRLRFEIAPENAKASGLVFSSKLLALARIVNNTADTTAGR